MKIREANINDSDAIKRLYLKAFDHFEAELVSDLAVNFLQEESVIKTISLVSIENDVIIGHVAFSPVFLESTNQHFGYILAPLAVLPSHQKKGIGTTIVKHGLRSISSLGAFIVFVYGDPQYYSRFGFKIDLAGNFTPPYKLQYPEGLQALGLNSPVIAETGKFKCVKSLNEPTLW